MRTVAVAALVASVLVCGASAGFYEKGSEVVNLDSKSFESEVLKSDDVWIVEFYAPWCGHCKSLVPEYIKAAKALKGHAKLGAVDATVSNDLSSKYGVEGFPTIKIFGKDKAAPGEHQGGRRAADFIVSARNEAKAMGKTIPKLPEEEAQSSSGFYAGSDVVELTDETFESEVVNGNEAWLVEFYAPWCGHCKTLAPEWKKAATALAGSIKIAAIDATAHSKFSNKYNVQGFPTLKFFAPGKAEAPEDYQGARSAEAIINFGMQKAELFPGKPVEVVQIEGPAALEALVEKKSNVGVFIVPHVIDTTAAGRNELVAMFGRVASKLRGKSIAFGWVVGGEHTRFEEALGIYTNYPAFAVLNGKKLRSATLKGAFTEEALVGMVRKVFDGKLATTQLKELPRMSKNVPLWDGKDYVPSDE